MKDKFHHLITYNLPLKIVSIFLAAMSWYFVMGEEILEINRRLDVRIIVPDGYMIKEGDRRTKYVKLRGPRVYLGPIVHQRELNAIVRLNDIESKKMRYQLGRSDIVGDLDPRVIVDILDPLIDLELGEIVSKQFPIKEVIRGNPAVGSILQKITIEPNIVVMKGMNNLISTTEFVFTDPIDISNLSQSKTIDVTLARPEGEMVEIVPAKVKATIQIGEEQINKIFNNIPIVVQGAGRPFRLRQPNVSIEIQGLKATLDSINPSDFSAFVDVGQLDVGNYERRVQVKIPPNTTLIETQPQQVLIDIYPKGKK